MCIRDRITGASRGIGKAIALKLAGQGANIAIPYLGDPAEAEQAQKEIEVAQGFHLFPFRTEKLSLVTPMVLRHSGRVGSCRF